MIIRPANDDGVRSTYKILLFPCFRLLDRVTDFTSDLHNRLPGWLNQEFFLIFSEVPTQKVKTIIDMSDQSLSLRQRDI